MPSYRATFKLALPVKIKTDGQPLPPLRARYDRAGVAITISLTPKMDEDFIESFACEVAYDGEGLTHASLNPTDLFAPVSLLGGALESHPPIAAMDPIVRTLRNLSALTLQWEIFRRSLHQDIEWLATDLWWHLPDGRRVPGILVPRLMFALVDLQDPARRPVNVSDWSGTQGLLDGRTEGAALWRVVLADAHLERGHDIRNVVLKCATALDVGVQPFMATLAVGTSPIDVLSGQKGVRTPDLRNHEVALYNDLAQLWYTRHAIIHRGKAEVYDHRPDKPGVQPLGPLTPGHVERFLCAVP